LGCAARGGTHLDKVEQDDHLDDEEDARPKLGYMACAQHGAAQAQLLWAQLRTLPSASQAQLPWARGASAAA